MYLYSWFVYDTGQIYGSYMSRIKSNRWFRRPLRHLQKCNSKSASWLGGFDNGWMVQSIHPPLIMCPTRNLCETANGWFLRGISKKQGVKFTFSSFHHTGGHNHLQFRVFGTRETIHETSQVLNGISSLRDCKAKCTSVCKPPNTPGPRWKLCASESTGGSHPLFENTYLFRIEWQILDLGWGAFAWTETDDCWDIEPPHQSYQKGSLIGWLEESEDAL